MATPSIPQMMARQMVQRLAGGAPQGGGPAGPQGPGGPNAGDQISAQLSELQGADPGAIGQALHQVKSILVSLYPRTAFSVPGVARNLAQAQKYIDNAIQETEKAAATAQAVTPIANQAAIPNPAMGAGLQDFASGGGA